MKKSRWIAAVFAAVLLGLCAALIFCAGKPPAVLVNEMPVHRQEFLWCLQGCKTSVQMELAQQLASKDDFAWADSWGGKTGYEHWMQAALQEAVRRKVVQQMAVQYGLLPDAGYSFFVQEWKEENSRRHKALQNRQPVYGPKEYTQEQYYQYRQNNLELQVRELFGDALRPAIREEDIEREYARNTGYFLDQPLETVRENVVELLVRQAFEEEIEKRAATAQITGLDERWINRQMRR